MASSKTSIDTISKALQELTLTEVTSLEKELGRGAYGKVFTVRYHETVCAAKEIHSLLVESATPEEKREIKNSFLRECYNCSVLRHPNIVEFIGLYYPQKHYSLLPVMVMELMKDSLTNYVKISTIDLKIKYSILRDVGNGLSYLHGHNPPVIHRDLTPNNILMSSNSVAKISDLGVAKVVRVDSQMTKSRVYTQVPGCVDFMPPEALETNPIYSVSLDIFSYGGIVLHVVNQEWPSPESQVKRHPKSDKLIALSEVERRQKHLDKMKDDDAKALLPLVKGCLNNNPSKRPQISTVLKILEPSKVTCCTYVCIQLHLYFA